MKIIVIDVMEFVDIHTHKLPEEPQNSLHGKIITVVNCLPNADIERFEYCSVGIHPWDVTKNWQDDFEILKKRVLQPQVVAIGECGLDKLRGGEWSLQKDCFQAQIDLAKQTGKPL
ncbi:MAG: TatD family hydrolase, partial [Bacteroidaceae bacterium]|nr:TatD family hydrolase [Bacteroidaceae bacterium]